MHPSPRIHGAHQRLRGASLVALGLIALFTACDDRTSLAPQPTDPGLPLNVGPPFVKIAFSRPLAGNFPGQIFTMFENGNALVRRTSFESEDIQPDWSPDGSKIAFSRLLGALGRDIFVMNGNGTQLVNLTSDNEEDFNPNWSPDGTRIAFASDRGPEFDLNIWVMNADGSGPLQLTSDPINEGEPSWSPDGSKIAFAYVGPPYTSPYTGIYVMNSDGTNVVRLTGDFDEHPTWSPDGTKIAFSRPANVCLGGGTDIFTMNADGTGVTKITSAICGEAYIEPDWSWDLDRLVFARNRVATEGFSDFEIYVMNPDGTGMTRLTNDDKDDHSPAWSK